MSWIGNPTPTARTPWLRLLTVPFRRHFPGGKPLILVTATKSHAGKSTVVDFIRGRTPKLDLMYESIDWPMQRSLREQLEHFPEAGVVNFDNVRLDSSGRGKIISSSFTWKASSTSSEVIVSSTRGKPFWVENRFVVLLNSNEGSLSIDLLNRALPIRLAPSGDLTDRLARSPIGDPKHEWLPANQELIEAEMWGMINAWIEEGKPLDKSVKHPMGPWAQAISGILMVNGFAGFLNNYSATRATADPIREAIGVLAFRTGDKPRRAGELAKIVVRHGLEEPYYLGPSHRMIRPCQRSDWCDAQPLRR